MEVYAAQIDRMDQGIGRILAALEKNGQLDNTLVIFLADNGACAEDIPGGVTIDELVQQAHDREVAHAHAASPCTSATIPARMPGPENTYQSYGTAWANLSNTPFRLYKHWIHEGGISTPLIVHWPEGITDKGAIRHAPGYLPDIMATILDVTGTPYPRHWDGQPIEPLEGTVAGAGLRARRARAAADVLGARRQCRGAHRQVEAGAQLSRRLGAVRHGGGSHRAARPRGASIPSASRTWRGSTRPGPKRCGVIDREKIVALMASQGVTRAFWEKP